MLFFYFSLLVVNQGKLENWVSESLEALPL